MKRLAYPVLCLALPLLSACAGHSTSTATLDGDARSCTPLVLQHGQPLVVTLPSNPTTGFRWSIIENAVPQLQSLGQEVYSNPEGDGLIGAEGRSTWRFRAAEVGSTHLKFAYQRPWETEAPPSQVVDCAIEVR